MVRLFRLAFVLAVALGLGVTIGCGNGPSAAPEGDAANLPAAPDSAAPAPPALGPPPP